ncbi:MAG TPA: tRNA preQ1(34) S-adenosylmethionine ribosyltransferase-isomerase QueA [Candidatus Methylomirabilis sp.]|nr:tRNA preQ1(34) S-adenosylmethionine ribosyltransferase-isomerase QueA [Candidatus Methylomirabilis sp.]
MNIGDFDYHLPDGLIAQYPLPERDASRLLVVRREDGEILHRRFREVSLWLQSGDLLVLNDAKVIPARLYGRRTGGGKAEVLLIEEESPNRWWALVRPGKALPVGRRLHFSGGVGALVIDRHDGGRRLLQFDGTADIRAELPALGVMPLPPYVKRSGSIDGHTRADVLDAERYQTVFAMVEGSIAAPTAGLHFTRALLTRLEQHGVEIASLTLHVGVGTFTPVTVERVEEHRMAAERYTIPERTAAAIKRAKNEARRVVAVGSTTTRALEDAALDGGGVRAGEGMASLFITPGYHFRVVDALLTNFHLPRSTLLILVSAFAGGPLIGRGYEEAIQQRYRFYSYGDAMLIV